MSTILSDLSTPSIIINKHAFVKNCRIVLEQARKHNMKLRPHVKTHKTLEGAFIQATGAANSGSLDKEDDIPHFWPEVTGFVASTIPEISMLVNGAIKYGGPFNDILYGVPTGADLSKLSKINHLRQKLESTTNGHIHVMVDHITQVTQIEQFLVNNNNNTKNKFSVFLKIDTGYHRAGVPWDDERSVKLAFRIMESDCLELKGIYSHCGHAYDINDLNQMNEIAKADLSKMIQFQNALKDHLTSLKKEDKYDATSLDISVGSTPSLFSHSNESSLPKLKMHPGNYTLYDRQQLWTGACKSKSDVAVRILSRVIGHYPDRNTIMLDCGATALTKEATPQGGVCEIDGYSETLECFKMSQEMILVRPIDHHSIEAFPFEDFPMGKIVSLIPNHSCLAAACFDRYHIIDDSSSKFSSHEKVIGTWIPAKGW